MDCSFGRARFFGNLVFFAFCLSACSVNPATGDRQFTALMPEGQEARLGQAEHEKVLRQFGGPFPNRALEAYVDRVGQRVAQGTERPDVTYKFFVLDTPVVNAFALPGGYIYVSRGLLALVGDEAELAGVLAHEIGHITARHSAERYSQNILAGLGMVVLSAAVNDPGITRAAGLGSELALKSYSRTQENQADELGIRYLAHAGYDAAAASRFLAALDRWSDYEAHRAGKKPRGGSYFDTHPQTTDRVARTVQIAAQYPTGQMTRTADYLHHLEGLTYGESARTGFIRGNRFIHPDLGLTLDFPEGFMIQNQPDQVVGLEKATGAAVIFDGMKNPDGKNPADYLRLWIGGQSVQAFEEINVSGHSAATAQVNGAVNGQTAQIRLVAVAWTPGIFYRFQIAMPSSTPLLEKRLIAMVHSLRPLTAVDRAHLRPLAIALVRARRGDTVEGLVAQVSGAAGEEDPVDRFRVLNGMGLRDSLEPGRTYKIIR